MKIYVAHSTHFDFKNKLYVPLRSSELNKKHEFLLPQEAEIEEISRDMIKDSDTLVADVSVPSLGAGIEMGWADAFGVPIIAMSEQGAMVTFSIDNVVTKRIEYSNSEDMLQKLEAALENLQ